MVLVGKGVPSQIPWLNCTIAEICGHYPQSRFRQALHSLTSCPNGLEQ